MFQKKIYTFISIIFLVLLASLLYCLSIQNSLSSKVLRLHILANSNSIFDQELKLKVRDEVVNYLTPLLKNSSSLTETKKIIQLRTGASIVDVKATFTFQRLSQYHEILFRRYHET